MGIEQTVKIIVGIGGPPQAGKDTAASRLVQQYGFHSKAFSELITDDWREHFDTEPTKADLQEWGSKRREEKGEWFWVTQMALWARPLGRVVIPGVRFPQEIEWIQRQYHWCLIRVDSTRRDAFSRDASHICEHALDQYDGWNYIIGNDGSVDELYEAVDACMLDWAEKEVGVRPQDAEEAAQKAA